MVEAPNEFRVEIATASRLYDRNDAAFLEQVNNLRQDLLVGGIGVVDEKEPGRKGGAEVTSIIDTIVAGGAGLTSLCGIVRLWLRQRGDRLVRMIVRAPNGTVHTIELEGKNVSDKALTEFAESVAKQLK